MCIHEVVIVEFVHQLHRGSIGFEHACRVRRRNDCEEFHVIVVVDQSATYSRATLLAASVTSLQAMRISLLRVALLAALVTTILLLTKGSSASGSSSSSWHQELEQAQSSDASTSGFSSDEVLISASDELDRDLELYSRRLELRHLVEQLRVYEKPLSRVIKNGALGSREYEVHTVVDRLPSDQLSRAMVEHFKSPSRVIGLLNNDVAVTVIVAKRPYSDQIARWSLDGEASHILFWRVSPDKTTLRFLGLATVNPPTVARQLHSSMQKLVPTIGRAWDYHDFQFLPPDSLRLSFPLMLKHW